MTNTYHYSDHLRSTMEQCGLPVSPVVRRDEQPCLRYDAIDVTETAIVFLWLGKPVFMVHRNQDNLVHVMGEIVLDHLQ